MNKQKAYMTKNTISRQYEYCFASLLEAEKYCHFQNLLNIDTNSYQNQYNIVKCEVEPVCVYKSFDAWLRKTIVWDGADSFLGVIENTLEQLSKDYFNIFFPDDTYYYPYGTINGNRDLLLSDCKVDKWRGNQIPMNKEDFQYVLSSQDELASYYQELSRMHEAIYNLNTDIQVGL